MKRLFSAAGAAALRATLGQRPLVAFDFDGTLAPIVARPSEARISLAVARRLARLTERVPVAIVTGRSLSDVRERLGFSPHYVIGNHGAEDDENLAADTSALDGLRQRLARHGQALASAGVSVEDKGLSIALHYRLARSGEAALRAIDDALTPLAPEWRRFEGKRVVNLAGARAPDKAAAMFRLVQRSGAVGAFFAGDDINDEAVFDSAPPHWLTVRVGCDGRSSRARFCIEGPQDMAALLDQMLALLEPA